LDHLFYHTNIEKIPYLQFVEIPISFAETELCFDYKDIALQITATCERPTTRSQVYQYEVAYDSKTHTVSVQYDQLRGAENSTVTIPEISWDPSLPSYSHVSASASSDATGLGLAAASSAYYGGAGGGDTYYGGFEGVTGGGATDGRSGDGGKRITSLEVLACLLNIPSI